MSPIQKDCYLYDKENNIIKDKPWIFRTYGGHTNSKATNNLFRNNLAKGQTGLSIAFDLATQCGYDSDHPIAIPEVGKVGVPINSLDDFRILFDQIPLEEMNTSMTINGTAMWLLSLYIALAEERGIDISKLMGTTQNDLIKEYLSRGTYIFPPDESFKLIVDMYEYCLSKTPKWNPSNICSYHLQEAGATPVQELSFALANAMQILDLIKERNCFTHEQFEECVGRISFFVNAGMRFVEEMCKMRAFVELWEEITTERYKVQNSKYRIFRYGVQVNSLGLTEEQPENNAWRILIQSFGVTLSRKARCRALQLPAWNEALSLPRPWDQQWSLRLQQVLAYETDLLEYPDIFDGSKVIEAKTKELKEAAKKEIDRIHNEGGVIQAIKSGTMKSALVRSQTDRISKIMNNEMIVIGRNKFTEGIPSPLVSGNDGGIFTVNQSEIEETLQQLKATRAKRNEDDVKQALSELEQAAKEGKNLMSYSIKCAKVLVTTGEWAFTLRKVYGEYRPPTGVEGQKLDLDNDLTFKVRERVENFKKKYGKRPRFVLGKPGLDGHSNGAEMIAVAARYVGFDLIYSGIRLSYEEIVQSAIEEDADLLGVSILSGSHKEICKQIIDELEHHGAKNKIPVIIGGIIPEQDFADLKKIGISAIYTPKNFDLIKVMNQNMDIIEEYSKNT